MTREILGLANFLEILTYLIPFVCTSIVIANHSFNFTTMSFFNYSCRRTSYYYVLYCLLLFMLCLISMHITAYLNIFSNCFALSYLCKYAVFRYPKLYICKKLRLAIRPPYYTVGLSYRYSVFRQ